MTCHELFDGAQYVGWLRPLKMFATRRLFYRYRRIHLVTEDARDNFESVFPEIDGSKLCVIPHGIDTARFQADETLDLRRQFRIDAETPIIGFFGRFMPVKGFRVLVDAVDQMLRNSALPKLPVVVTFGYGGYIREEFARIHQLGLQDYFYQVPHTENMPQAIRGVDIVAMPSLAEAAGLLAMETLVAGTPLVASDCHGLREVVRDTPAATSIAGDSRSLARSLSEMIRNPREEEFHKFRKIAASRFDARRSADAMRGLYEEVLLG
jgi:glycosyltransferase involved in cell wall biosynthesis